jgi:hypothetical protein
LSIPDSSKFFSDNGLSLSSVVFRPLQIFHAYIFSNAGMSEQLIEYVHLTFRWYHQVISHPGRNLAVNVWSSHSCPHCPFQTAQNSLAILV